MPDIYFNKDKNRQNGNKNGARPSNQGGQRNYQRRRYQPYEPQQQPRRPEQTNRVYHSASYNSRGTRPQQTPVRVRQPRQRHTGRTILCILLVLVILYMITAHILFGGIDYNGKYHRRNQYISSISLRQSPRVTNILLLGVDARQGETISRADTMMLLSLDRGHRQIKLTSFLRDSYVEIPDRGMNKLNASCSEGGVQLVIDTIEYNYHIKIDKYVVVDFQAFTALIDSLGGVDVPVTYREANYLNRTWYKWSLTGNPVHFDSGDSVHLDGEKALMFCRIRKLDSDVQRTRRQRLVMECVQKKLGEADTGALISAVRSFCKYLTTDISAEKLLHLAIQYGTRYKRYDTYSESIPASGTYHDEYTNAGDSLVFDIDENASILKDFVFNDAASRDSSFSLFS